MEKAISIIKPWETRLGDLGEVIVKHAKENGYTIVREIGGHGVGLAMHEDPYVAHVGKRGTGMLLVPGMVFTIEPMINAGSYEVTVQQRCGTAGSIQVITKSFEFLSNFDNLTSS